MCTGEKLLAGAASILPRLIYSMAGACSMRSPAYLGPTIRPRKQPPVMARYEPRLLSLAAWNLMDDHAAEVDELIIHFIAVGFAAGYAEAVKYYQKNESKEGAASDDL